MSSLYLSLSLFMFSSHVLRFLALHFYNAHVMLFAFVPAVYLATSFSPMLAMFYKMLDAHVHAKIYMYSTCCTILTYMKLKSHFPASYNPGPYRLMNTDDAAPLLCPQYAMTYFEGCHVTVAAGPEVGMRWTDCPVSVAHCTRISSEFAQESNYPYNFYV